MSTTLLVSESGRPDAAFRPIEPAQRSAAKLVGFLYLFQMATAIFGQSYVRDHLIVRGDVTRSAQNIVGAERLFRLSIAGDLVTYTSVIVLIWAFYVLVRPVNRNLAFLAVLFSTGRECCSLCRHRQLARCAQALERNFAYLLLKSRYVPRALAGWGIFSSLLFAIVTWIIIVFPGLGKTLGLTYMGPMGLYEVGLGLWLLIKGIEPPISFTTNAAGGS